MGIEETGHKGLFHKSSLKQKNTVFTIGKRGEVLTSLLEADIIIPHSAQKSEVRVRNIIQLCLLPSQPVCITRLEGFELNLIPFSRMSNDLAYYFLKFQGIHVDNGKNVLLAFFIIGFLKRFKQFFGLICLLVKSNPTFSKVINTQNYIAKMLIEPMFLHPK